MKFSSSGASDSCFYSSAMWPQGCLAERDTELSNPFFESILCCPKGENRSLCLLRNKQGWVLPFFHNVFQYFYLVIIYRFWFKKINLWIMNWGPSMREKDASTFSLGIRQKCFHGNSKGILKLPSLLSQEAELQHLWGSRGNCSLFLCTDSIEKEWLIGHC